MNKRFSEALSTIIVLAAIIIFLGALAKTLKVDELISEVAPEVEDLLPGIEELFPGGDNTDDVGGSDNGSSDNGDSGSSGDNTQDEPPYVEIENITLPEKIIF